MESHGIRGPIKNMFDVIKNNNTQAFRFLFDSLGYSFSFLSERTHSVTDTEDILQEVFLSLWNKRTKIEVGDSIYPYLFKAARYEVIDWMVKSEKRVKHFEQLQVKAEKDINCLHNTEDKLMGPAKLPKLLRNETGNRRRWGLTTLGFFQSKKKSPPMPNQYELTLIQVPAASNPVILKFADITGMAKFGLESGIDLRVFLQGVGKRNYYPSGGDHYFWGIYAQPWASLTKFNLDHWTPENPNAYLPRPKSYVAEQSGIELAATQTRYIQNAGYLRIKNVTVGYTLPKYLTDKWGVERIRIFGSGENLFEFTKLMDYLDPEIVGDRTAYPFQRTYSLGLNFIF
ncbi:hypothetical protein FQR65_LT17581 [Abscondita terminalis]|nr:hypothetical protein FQR65_LT17581 [Abscondita terminalis]